MSRILHFDALNPRQSGTAQVFCFVARARDIQKIAQIERIGRNEKGGLSGFQRPQIATHIHEIQDYLELEDSILPNAIIVGFIKGALLEINKGGRAQLAVDVSNGPPGWVVDGQQRFTALSGIKNQDYEVLVSGFMCASEKELQKQFILINSTRPLPKALIYELLPKVPDLPHRMSDRSQAALLVEALNYRLDSSLRGLIKQHTNPKGIVADTILHKFIMSSISDGALALYANNDQLLLKNGYSLLNEFFHAVKHVFREDWEGHTPKTSRLVHGAGIVAMGYVMEALNARDGANDRTAFANGLRCLVGKTSWAKGQWRFGDEVRNWNSLQNTSSDIRQLSLYLVSEVKRSRVVQKKSKQKSRVHR